MFYAHFVLAKKGPLARIWLAAHWDKKLTKAHVFETNIEKSVDGILQPKVKMALRTSGHLLLGVVRIYSRKAKYLLADCNEAFVKIKMAFRPGMVDLPEEHREAEVNAITLPEVFHDFDTAMPELKDVDIEAQFSLNQSRAEEITMREDYGSLSLVTHDQGFGDMSFDVEPPELLRHTSNIDAPLDQRHMLFTDDGAGIEAALEQQEKEAVAGTSTAAQPMDIDTPIRDDGFGGHLGQDMISGGLFEGGLFDEAPMGEVPVPDVSSIGEQQEPNAAAVAPSVHDDSDEDMGDHFGGPPSPIGGMSSDGSRPPTPATTIDTAGGRISVASRRFTPAPQIADDHAMDGHEEQPVLQEQTTLLHDEEESFALAPVDASALKGFTKAKRKRKLIVDEVKNISGEEMKAQLSDTSDIVTTLDLAPPTKRLMHWKETGGVEKLFALPARPIPARVLFKNYQRHLTSKTYDHDDFGRLDGGGDDVMPLEQMRDEPKEPEPVFEQSGIQTRRSTRKRKAPADEEPPSPPPADITHPSTVSEPVEQPSMQAVQELSSEPSPVHQPEVSLPQEPAVPDISSIMSAVDQSDMIGAGASSEHPLLGMEMPQIPPNEVSSLLGSTEEHVDEQQHHDDALPPSDLPQMENMGYDQNAPPVSYMGYDDQHPPAHTPGAISERGPATPWNHEDYEFPPSVGPQEEQQMDETYEQFEERVLNKRAAHMYQVIKNKLDTRDNLTLSEMTHKSSRKQAAQKFYTLLVLKKFQVLEINQECSYVDIYVTKGPKFDNPAL
ncbi:PREDICTED: double-strand-break repair protein rad21-like protein 1 isoform X2 [Ceratosolen solmsi marchali]|uniref:Double-strand-break repair protein rad21-like protein 1 isoform X2 n=1 Tax=Ceratosolen solmsi marchali TaxID=326594 RepID=A0AAJ6YKT1_9HYME|nr:PREDICTED: double-strand-break repair protein rad21-like protein 1 isoform X2 [Ceratosolen solmsi marchali]